MPSVPRALDLFCCQGAASKGYTDAGFDVDAVDRDPQPRFYPGARFHQADAFAYLAEHGDGYDFYHGSPMCQGYSDCQRIQGNDHPMQIADLRDAFIATGKPYVIENVVGARWAMRDPIELCGCMFPDSGLRTYRPRLFESNIPLTQPEHREHVATTVKMGRPLKPGDWYHAVGNFSNVPYVRENMGVPWMTRDGIRECIPPVYAEFVGRQVMAYLAGEAATAAA
jgi:DNA (cytosine-5)-methyltransferase 1